MAYVAIYAASPAFYEQHKDWGLYDREGQPIDFGDGYLYIMNPAQGSGWREHMIREWLKIVETYDFDGLHIDQYGYPKVAYDARGRTVMVGPAFRSFLDETKEKLAEQMPQRSRITFNSVANWPAALVAESSFHPRRVLESRDGPGQRTERPDRSGPPGRSSVEGIRTMRARCEITSSKVQPLEDRLVHRTSSFGQDLTPKN